MDLIVTDPPYGMAYESGWSAASVSGDGIRNCLRMYRQVVPEIVRIMKPLAHMYWFTRWDVWNDTSDILAPHIPVRNALVWDKGHPGMGNLALYGHSFEMIVFAAQGNRPLNGGGRPGSIFRCLPVPVAHRLHPTEKPIALLSEWIERSSHTADLVLDPFMGSGATLLACQSLGRRAIGIEIEERYCEIAAKRLAQEVLAL